MKRNTTGSGGPPGVMDQRIETGSRSSDQVASAIADVLADAGADLEMMAFDIERTAQAGNQTAGDLRGDQLVVNAFAEHREFITAMTRDQVGGPHAHPNPFGHRDKHGVAYVGPSY